MGVKPFSSYGPPEPNSQGRDENDGGMVQAKFQAQIDALKRTVNELTLRSQLTPLERDRLRHTLQ
jgi:tetrahydromethanopterin S-methyltransferase subunit F